jgi:hypothetical protein
VVREVTTQELVVQVVQVGVDHEILKVLVVQVQVVKETRVVLNITVVQVMVPVVVVVKVHRVVTARTPELTEVGLVVTEVLT